MSRETPEAALVRWEKLKLVQGHYPHFVDFLRDGMEELGFSSTDIQIEIGDYMEYGPQHLMVQAQRSQAKTTVAALFAVWSLIHSPHWRVLIISAGGTQANEISTLIVRVINTMDVLECLRPDRMAGDRTSTEAFDVHHSLKGLDKSPSVACVGIDSNLQGKRADLLIPDDVESSKNSATALQREKLLHLTKDFVSICQNGRIIWLGTPQTMESIYNSLPSRGVEIRIWPGRYPTATQVAGYGSMLAPGIVTRLTANPALGTGGGISLDQGQPLDPVLLGELALQLKELNQGKAYFQLQHMLSTKLSDELKFPLKTKNLIVVHSDMRQFPLTVVRDVQAQTLRQFQVGSHSFQMAVPMAVSPETSLMQAIWAYIDPAPGGENGDETAWAIGGFLNSSLWLLSAGGMPGGYELEKMQVLADLLVRFKITGCKIEKNMGWGAFRNTFAPILQAAAKKVNLTVDVQDDVVGGQKEKRIIDTLSPIIGRGSLIIDERVVDEDRETIAKYEAVKQQSYSLFFQLAKLTMVRNVLHHDDRADALAGLCNHFAADLELDQEKQLKRLAAENHAKMMKDPLGHMRFIHPSQRHGGSSPFKSILKGRR